MPVGGIFNDYDGKSSIFVFFLFPTVFRKSPNSSADGEKQQILTFESNSPSFFTLWPFDRLFGADSTKGRISAGVPVE